MTQLTDRAVARCEDCSKTYRVPDPSRAYACKSCGGIVRASDAPAEGPAAQEGMVLCPDCQTLNPPSAEVCAECEADLADADLVEDEEEAAELLEEAGRAFKRAYVWGRVVTWTYHFGAAAYAVATLFAVLALADPDVPAGGGVLVVALTTLLSVLMGTAALHLLFHPFLWTLSVAVLATAVAGVHAVGPNPLGIALLGSAIWAALSWALLVPARHFRTLIERHKDLYVLHHASQRTKRSLKGRTAGDRHERLMRAMRHADRRAWKVSGAAAIALIAASWLGSWVILTSERPQGFDEALTAFETTWDGGSAADLGPLFDAKVRETETVWLGAVTAGHGWGAGLPTLPAGTRREGPDRTFLDYEIDGVPVTASFYLGDLSWKLIHVEVPYPPIEPAFERFQEAWRAADPVAMATFFSPENRARKEADLQRSKERRGWTVFPAIVGAELEPDGDRKAIGTLDLGEEQVITKWYFRDDGAWGLYGLEMPTIKIKRGAGGSGGGAQ